MKPNQSPSELREALAGLTPALRQSMWFTILTNLLSLLPIVYMNSVYGTVLNSRDGLTLLMLTLLLIGGLAVMELLEWVRLGIMTTASFHFHQKLSRRVFDATFTANLQQSAPGAHQALHHLRAIRSFIASPALMFVLDAPVSLLFLALIFSIDPIMGATSCVGAVAMFITGWLTERKVQPLLTQAQTVAMEAQSYAADSLKNAHVIEALGMLGNIERRWQKLQRKYLLGQALASDRAGSSGAASKFVMMSQGSLLLGFGAFLTIQGHLPGGGASMIIASILGGRAIQPLIQLISAWKQVVLTRDAYARLDDFLQAVPERKPGMPMPAPKGAVSVEDISVRAPASNEPILRSISFDLSPGSVLAVVGPSASGKSTLAKAMIGIWPAMAGCVRLDGVEVYGWDKAELGPCLGYLPQEVELFDGSLAENIARFGAIEQDKVQAAATSVGLHEYISSLPQGYDTPIGDDGCILSGGVRQRVGLARAIYGNPRLVILDEPNSSLDEVGDRALLETIFGLKANGTTVMVATHRTSIMPAVDQILVLNGGRLQLFGPRDPVLAKLRGEPYPPPPSPSAVEEATPPTAALPPPEAVATSSDTE